MVPPLCFIVGKGNSSVGMIVEVFRTFILRLWTNRSNLLLFDHSTLYFSKSFCLYQLTFSNFNSFHVPSLQLYMKILCHFYVVVFSIPTMSHGFHQSFFFTILWLFCTNFTNFHSGYFLLTWYPHCICEILLW